MFRFVFTIFFILIIIITIIVFSSIGVLFIQAKGLRRDQELSLKIYQDDILNNSLPTPQQRPSNLSGLPLFPITDEPISQFNYNTLTDEKEDFSTIFVSVAAFRDPECIELVREIYAYSINPRRIIVGIIEQIEPGDPICIPPEIDNCSSAEFCFRDNIRRRRVVSKRGKGPTYGRYVSLLMYRGESYYMMIDSHTGFIRHWDRRVLFSLRRARSPRPVLSHYPHKWIKQEPSFRESQHLVAVMCNGHYVGLGFIRLDGRMLPRSLEPWPAPFAAAGFLFADARLTHDVPFDPLLDYIFDGEEILYSTRMWTNGYDIFAPEISYVFHSYGRRNASKYWGTQYKLGANSTYARAVYWSRKRVQYFLHVTEENTTKYVVPREINVGRVRWGEKRYGLGRYRSLNAYNRYAMIDPIHRKAPAWFCAKIGQQRGKV